jgi:hypothetical protein
VCKKALFVPHLLFVDDFLILLKADKNYATSLKNVNDDYLSLIQM